MKRFTATQLQRLLVVTSPAKFYLLAMLVGLVSGFIALAFAWAVAIGEEFTFFEFAGIDLGAASGEFRLASENPALEFNPLYFFLLPIIGGLVSGLLENYIQPGARNQTTDRVLAVYHNEAGHDSLKTAVSKFWATIVTICSGGSAGREGPMGLIGASTASGIARVFKLGPKAARSLYLAGMAGTLGAIFQTPLGAAIFTSEVVYKDDIEADSLLPCIVSSVMGYFVYTSFIGFDSMFSMPSYVFENWDVLFIYAGLAGLCFFFGYLFVKTKSGLSAMYARLSWPFPLKVASGGLVVGIVSLFSYESIGTGFGFLQSLFNTGTVADISPLSKSVISQALGISPFWGLVLFLLCIVLLKIVATAFTIASGGCGGVFGPSIFLGALLGAIVGFCAMHLFPDVAQSPVPFMVVGMGGFLAGVSNTPLASLIMVTELTGSYQLMPAIMVVAALSLIISSRFSIYKEQKQNRFDSPAHTWDILQDFLRTLSIRDTIDFKRDRSVLASDFPVKKLQQLSRHTQQTDFIIYQREKHIYMGMLSLRHVQQVEGRSFRSSKLNAGDIIEQVVPPLSGEDTLSDGLEHILMHDFDKIPVVNPDDGILLGYLTFRDVLKGYRRGVRREHLLKSV